MSFRLLLNMIYVGALFLITGSLYQWLMAFEGEMPIGRGASEHLVVREGGGGLMGMGRALPAELLPYANPQAARMLSSQKRYESVTLPFFLALDRVEIIAERPPRHTIGWNRGGEREQRIIDGTGEICFGPMCFQVLGVEPWSGLLFQPGAQPMALLAMDGGDQEQRIMLERGQGRSMGQAYLSFSWFANSEEAAAAFPERLDPGVGMRWGVEDGGAMHWMSNPMPGQGLITQDGRDFTVLEIRADAASETVLQIVEEKGESRTIHALRPGDASTAPLFFEAPALMPMHLRIHGFRDGAAWVACYQLGEQHGLEQLESGASFQCGDLVFSLENLMSSAIPVVGDDLAIAALRLESKGQTILLREGLARDWEGGQLRFRSIPQSPVARYTIVHRSENEASREYSLGPSERIRIDNWYFSLADDGSTPEMVLLVARRSGFARPSARIGAFLLVLGAFGWAGLRIFQAPQRISRDKDENFPTAN